MMARPEAVSFPSQKESGVSGTDVADELEKGNVVQFPDPELELPDEEDLEFLRTSIENKLTRKNVTYYPEMGHLRGLENHPDAEERTLNILTDHMDRVESFLEKVIPGLMDGVKRHKVDYRPKEEKERDISVRASSELIHVDAGAYWATHGDRILRFFVNIHPDRDRVWWVKGRLPELARQYREEIFPDRNGNGSIEPSVWGRMYTGMIDGLAYLIPPAKSLDTSPYDRAMRRLHNFMKESRTFQEEEDEKTSIAFDPMSAFMVFTDMVGHACRTGQYAICNTLIIPKENCRHPDLLPYNVLNDL